MKLSKKIAAIICVICLVLTSVQVMAASISLDTGNIAVIPEDGKEITITNCGFNAETGFRMVCSTKDLPTNCNGATLTATFINTNPGKLIPLAPATFTVDGAAITKTEIRADGGRTLCVPIAEIVKASPELLAVLAANVGETAYYLSGANTVNVTISETAGTNPTEGEAKCVVDVANCTPYKTTSAVLNKGNWAQPEIPTIETPFPEKTLYIGGPEFSKYVPAGWEIAADGTYSNFRKYSDATSDGPAFMFVAPEDGTYNMWVMKKDNSTKFRNIDFIVAGTYVSFNDKTAFANDTDMTWRWVKDRNSSSITLKKGQKIAVRMAFKGTDPTGYGRVGVLAFVPEATSTDLTTGMSASTSVFEPGNITALRQVTIPETVQGNKTVTATVNGSEVTANQGDGAIKGAALPELAGEYLDIVTVSDMVAAAGINPTTAIITYNNKVITNADTTEVKEGDVITTSNPDVSTFKPYSFINITTSNHVAAIGSANTGYPSTEEYPEAKLKLCVEIANEAKIAEATTVAAPSDHIDQLKGMHLSGYIVNTKEGGIIPFENVVITRSFPNAETGATRIDMNVATVGNDSNYTETIDGVVVNKLDKVNANKDMYDFSHLYLTNATNSVVTLNAERVGNSVVISTNGFKFVHPFVVTYDENGNITEIKEINPTYTTGTLKTTFVSVNEPITISVNDNQKVFVWEENSYMGTTMKPLTAIK